MRTSWEKFVKYVSTKYGQDIRNEQNKKIKSNIFSQVHSNKVLVRQATQEALVRTGQSNIQAASRAQVSVLRAAAIADPWDAELPMNIALLDNDITKGNYEIANEIPIEILDSEKAEYRNEWRTYRY